MAATGNLLLKNAAAAEQTYYPFSVINGDKAMYIDRTNSVLAAQSRASLFFNESTKTRKVTGKVTYPVLNATTGELSHTLIGTFEFAIPLIASSAERAEIRSRAADMIDDAIVIAAVDNGEMPW
jgi:hypothetical protein